MKKILFIPVNFNSYSELDSYLSTIDTSALKQEASHLSVDVIIADNSTQKQSIDDTRYSRLNISVREYENPGYFGGGLSVYNGVNQISKYDYVIISNVDLKVEENFFDHLFNVRLAKDVGWIAPGILSVKDNRDMNPKIVKRYSKNALEMLKVMYKFPFLKRLYVKTLFKAKHSDMIADRKERDIYAGHGSFIILTKAFVTKCPRLDYPVFLFGEEVFVGETVRLAGLKTRYVPSIAVFDDAHVSTGKLKSSANNKYNIEALTYLIKQFYE